MKNEEEMTMSEEKKTAAAEEVKAKESRLSMEELEYVSGGQFADDSILGSEAVAVLEALEGKVERLQVTSSSGDPGAYVNIRVRGAGSISASSDPLIVLDGFAGNEN